MQINEQRNYYLLIVIISALFVYGVGHFQALTNQYVINDDVRQQIYWMQRWQDPDLFRNDVLTRYAENYVPIGVKSIYYAFSGVMNPVQFSKVVTGFLFVINAVLLFLIGCRFGDNFTALIFSTGSLLFTSFITKISGGMSQSFAYPLMLLYLYYLASENLLGASVAIMIQSIFNPYIFVLCSLTHSLYLLKNHGRLVVEIFWPSLRPSASGISLFKLFLLNVPIIIGVVAMIVQHVFLRTTEFGDLISWVDIYGHVEYTSAGRYQLVPGPTFFWEIFRPVTLLVLFDDYGNVAGVLSSFAGLTIFFWAIAINKWTVNVSSLWFMAYLITASVILYFVSYEVIMRLFLPRRYVEFSFNLIYCIIFAACVSSISRSLNLKTRHLVLLVMILVGLGSLRIYNVGIYDYSKDSDLYDFMSQTPKDSVVAGPPEVIDNVVTFSRRKGFVTFELSHTWFTRYWKTIKKRTFDFFDLYYADDPAMIRDFAQRNGIDYMIVRERDFDPENMLKTVDGFEPFGSAHRSTAYSTDAASSRSLIYFEPFHSYVGMKYKDRKYFALLDEDVFKPVFRAKGYRVIELR